ncbi:Inositol 1,4,5-Trisphosphate Receptor Type 3 [Manis pentadactyla]|nr:Inositol 1,4,5-Trisphosphate Receptor Type 3 [Manis pentadactyla]
MYDDLSSYHHTQKKLSQHTDEKEENQLSANQGTISQRVWTVRGISISLDSGLWVDQQGITKAHEEDNGIAGDNRARTHRRTVGATSLCQLS